MKHGHRPTNNKIFTRYEIKGTFSTEVKVIGIIDLYLIYRTRHRGIGGGWFKIPKIWMILRGKTKLNDNDNDITNNFVTITILIYYIQFIKTSMG